MGLATLPRPAAAPEARIQSIGRAAALLEAMRDGGWVQLRDLARAVGLQKTTTFNLAMALVDVGLVEHDARHGAYRLGPRLAEFGRAVENRLSANG